MWTLLSPAPTTRVLSCTEEQTAGWTSGYDATGDKTGGQTDPVVDDHAVDLWDLQTGTVVGSLGPNLFHILSGTKHKYLKLLLLYCGIYVSRFTTVFSAVLKK